MTDTIMLEAPARGGRISDLGTVKEESYDYTTSRHHPSATPPMPTRTASPSTWPTKPKAQRVQAGESRSNGSPMKVTDRP